MLKKGINCCCCNGIHMCALSVATGLESKTLINGEEARAAQTNLLRFLRFGAAVSLTTRMSSCRHKIHTLNVQTRKVPAEKFRVVFARR